MSTIVACDTHRRFDSAEAEPGEVVLRRALTDEERPMALLVGRGTE